MKCLSLAFERLRRDQAGLIPLLLSILFVVGAIIYLVYLRVAQAQH